MSEAEKIFQLLRLMTAHKQHTLHSLASEMTTDEDEIKYLIRVAEKRGATVIVETRGRCELKDPIDWLDGDQIMDQAGGRLAALRRLDVFDEVDSTNSVVSASLSGQLHGRAVLAESQSAGRGRNGKHWFSPVASNLYLSLGWSFTAGVDALQGLSLALGTAIAEALDDMLGTQIQLKWPNDFFLADKKLGGILIETSQTQYGGCDAIVGIGINISMPWSAHRAIDQPWTDLTSHLGAPPARNALALEVIAAALSVLETYQTVGFVEWRDRWNRRDLLNGRQITVAGNNPQSGMAMGVDVSGHLLLDTVDGIETIVSGEASIATSDATPPPGGAM